MVSVNLMAFFEKGVIMSFRLCHELLGIDRGNFHINKIGPMNVSVVLDAWRKKEGVDNVYIPRCDFTATIVSEDSKIVRPIQDASWFWRTKDSADGIILGAAYDAAAILNADCPIVAVYESVNGKNRLAVLHAGFRCLVPKNKKERSIIRVLFEDFKFAPDSHVFMGYGIGPCCFGVKSDEYPEIDDFSVDLPCGKVTRGSRAGWRSIDLYKIILNQLLAARVPEQNIVADMTCTSCAGIYRPTYYSNCRLGPAFGRNAAMVWLEA